MYRIVSHRIVILLSVCAPLAFSQQSISGKSTLDSLLLQADSLVVFHKFSAARDLYTAVLHANEESVGAMIGFGKVELGDRSWSGAIDWLEKAAARDKTNLEARYYLGCAYAERGRARYFIEKITGFVGKSSFDKARAHLGWVLERDSLYRDALYQLALVSLFEQDYWRAVPLALRQIKLKPELRNGHAGVYKIYREAIAMSAGSQPPAQLENPSDDYSRFFLAEWQRRKGMLKEAEQELRSLQRGTSIVPMPLVLQSRARIEAAHDRQQDIERFVTMSIGQIKTLGDADLVFEDIKYIMTDQELEEYRSLKSAADARGFFTTFWTKRNPYPAENINVRIAEHYKRLVYAERYFEQFGRKTFASETMPLDFPQSYFLNEEFNDKGLIYLRHGEPHQKIATARSGQGPAESNESWLYHATDEYPEMYFDFYIPMGAHVTEWRLTPVLTDPSMWYDRMEYSRKYLRLSQSRSEVGVSSNLAMATDDGRESTSKGMSTDRYSYTREMKYFDSPVSVTCYRGPNGRTLVDVAYVIVPSEIAKGYPDSVRQFRVDAQYSMYDASWNRVAASEHADVYKRSSDPGNISIEIFHAAVKPDSYVVAWQARPSQTNMIFSRKQHTNVPDFSGTSLNMSDLELAYALEPASQTSNFVKGAFSVVPNPLRDCRLDRPLFLYFEAYNLAKDSKGKTSYTIEYRLTSLQLDKSFIARMFSGGKKTSISVPSERTGGEDWSREHIALDVSELESGKYQLQAKLTDNVLGASVSRSIIVNIYQPK